MVAVLRLSVELELTSHEEGGDLGDDPAHQHHAEGEQVGEHLQDLDGCAQPFLDVF